MTTAPVRHDYCACAPQWAPVRHDYCACAPQWAPVHNEHLCATTTAPVRHNERLCTTTAPVRHNERPGTQLRPKVANQSVFLKWKQMSFNPTDYPLLSNFLSNIKGPVFKLSFQLLHKGLQKSKRSEQTFRIYEGPNSKYFQLSGPDSLCDKYSTLPFEDRSSHRQHVNKLNRAGFQ